MIKNPPIIKKVAKKMGGKIKEIIPERGYFSISVKNREILVSRKFKISSSPLLGAEETKFKDLTYFLLQKENIPTPKTICLYRKNKTDRNKIEGKLASLEYPIIIKDAEGSNSKGVFANIKNEAQAKSVLKKAFKEFPRLIAQTMVSGNEYRVLILNSRIIGVLQLIPPRIIGDGKNTIKNLIEKKQKNTKQKTPLDFALNNLLKEQGYSLESIPLKGSFVYLRKNSCLAEGGEVADMTEKINKKIVAICAKAASTVGRCLAGIDIICQDIALDPKKQTLNIIEINGRPDIYIHYNPDHGKTRDVVREIINYILANKLS